MLSWLGIDLSACILFAVSSGCVCCIQVKNIASSVPACSPSIPALLQSVLSVEPCVALGILCFPFCLQCVLRTCRSCRCCDLLLCTSTWFSVGTNDFRSLAWCVPHMHLLCIPSKISSCLCIGSVVPLIMDNIPWIDAFGSPGHNNTSNIVLHVALLVHCLLK